MAKPLRNTGLAPLLLDILFFDSPDLARIPSDCIDLSYALHLVFFHHLIETFSSFSTEIDFHIGMFVIEQHQHFFACRVDDHPV